MVSDSVCAHLGGFVRCWCHVWVSIRLKSLTAFLLLCIQIERSDIKPSSSKQRDASSRRSSRQDKAIRRSSSPSIAESPLSSLPSNTEEMLKGRGWSSQKKEYVRRPHSSGYQPVVPSLPSNTEEVLRLRGSSTGRSAASSRSDADLARFCSNLYISQRQ